MELANLLSILHGVYVFTYICIFFSSAENKKPYELDSILCITH